MGDVHELGLVPRAVAGLLSGTNGEPLRVSMLELHNDTLVDLLAPRGQPGQLLEVRGGGPGTVARIEGAREVSCASVASTVVAIRSGFARRQVAATMVNAASSRSHV